LLPPKSRGRARRDWAAIAREYTEAALTVTEICALHGISVKTLYRRAAQEGWKMRHKCAATAPARAQRASLSERLLTALDQKMTEFENRMTQGGAATAADSERDARTLNTLVRLFEKLKGFGGKSEADAKAIASPVHAATSAGKDAHDADRLRHGLAQRLEKLREGLRG
jgi:transposase-like protein